MKKCIIYICLILEIYAGSLNELDSSPNEGNVAVSPTDMPLSQRDLLKKNEKMRKYLKALNGVKVEPQANGAEGMDIYVEKEKIPVPVTNGNLDEIYRIQLDQNKLQRYLHILDKEKAEAREGVTSIKLDPNRLIEYLSILKNLSESQQKKGLYFRPRIKLMKAKDPGVSLVNQPFAPENLAYNDMTELKPDGTLNSNTVSEKINCNSNEATVETKNISMNNISSDLTNLTESRNSTVNNNFGELKELQPAVVPSPGVHQMQSLNVMQNNISESKFHSDENTSHSNAVPNSSDTELSVQSNSSSTYSNINGVNQREFPSQSNLSDRQASASRQATNDNTISNLNKNLGLSPLSSSEISKNQIAIVMNTAQNLGAQNSNYSGDQKSAIVPQKSNDQGQQIQQGEQIVSKYTSSQIAKNETDATNQNFTSLNPNLPAPVTNELPIKKPEIFNDTKTDSYQPKSAILNIGAVAEVSLNSTSKPTVSEAIMAQATLNLTNQTNNALKDTGGKQSNLNFSKPSYEMGRVEQQNLNVQPNQNESLHTNPITLPSAPKLADEKIKQLDAINLAKVVNYNNESYFSTAAKNEKKVSGFNTWQITEPLGKVFISITPETILSPAAPDSINVSYKNATQDNSASNQTVHKVVVDKTDQTDFQFNNESIKNYSHTAPLSEPFSDQRKTPNIEVFSIAQNTNLTENNASFAEPNRVKASINSPVRLILKDINSLRDEDYPSIVDFSEESEDGLQSREHDDTSQDIPSNLVQLISEIQNSVGVRPIWYALPPAPPSEKLSLKSNIKTYHSKIFQEDQNTSTNNKMEDLKYISQNKKNHIHDTVNIITPPHKYKNSSSLISKAQLEKMLSTIDQILVSKMSQRDRANIEAIKKQFIQERPNNEKVSRIFSVSKSPDELSSELKNLKPEELKSICQLVKINMPTKPAYMHSEFYESRLKELGNIEEILNEQKKQKGTNSEKQLSQIINVNLKHLNLDIGALYKMLGKTLGLDDPSSIIRSNSFRSVSEEVTELHHGQNIKEDKQFNMEEESPIFPKGMLRKKIVKENAVQKQESRSYMKQRREANLLGQLMLERMTPHQKLLEGTSERKEQSQNVDILFPTG